MPVDSYAGHGRRSVQEDEGHCTIHNCAFTATGERYAIACPALSIMLSECPVVGTFTKKNTTQELILSIGEPEQKLKADPTYEKTVAEGHMRFFDPFRPKDFSPRIAGAVVRYYLAKASPSNQKQSFWSVLRSLFVRDRFHLALQIEGWSTIPEQKRQEFKQELSGNVSINKHRIEEPNA